MISLRNFGYRTPAKGVLGTCRSVFPREFSRNWQKMCTPHFLELWLFIAPLSLGCLTPPKTCWSPRNANYSGLFHMLLMFNCVLHNSSKDLVPSCCKIFLSSLLFSQQSSRYMKVPWNPVVTGGLFLSDALCTTSTWNSITSFPIFTAGKVVICSSHKLLLQHSHTESLSDCIYNSHNNIII